MRTVRYDESLDRFMLNFRRDDPYAFDVKRIEGRRHERKLRTWSTPATLHAWRKLKAMGFLMLQSGEGLRRIRWLEEGCPVVFRPRVHGEPSDLFPYQREGVARILHQRRLLLADDMGLGKTRQAIAAMMLHAQPKLVIAPKVLLRPWKDALMNYGIPAESIGMQVTSFREHQWALVNPERLNRFIMFEGEGFDLIVDEAHLFTNHKAKRTKYMLLAAEQASRVLLLTGTPPAQPLKLWPLALALGMRTPQEFFPFMLRYAAAFDNGFGWDYSGAVHLDELADEFQPYLLRRTKDQVLPDLPPKLHSTILASEGVLKRQEKELSQLDEEILGLVSRGHSLGGSLGIGAVQRLRVAASRSKLETTTQLVAARLPAKQLVFCEFRATMDELVQRLNANGEVAGAPILQLHGDLSSDERVHVVARFRNAPEGAVLICQFQLASLGLDLQAATCVVIHDLPWTPEQLDQAIDRAHRIGQRDSVHVITVLSRSHVEADMLQGLREGRKLTEAFYRQERTG